jgi:hypothetical protein
MTLRSSSSPRTKANRNRPALEGLEERKLLSRAPLGAAAAAGSSDGVFSQDNRVFSYTTPTGGHAVIQVVGLGNLLGTTVNPAGALELVYGDTNAFSKITGQVHGGGGHAPLGSIQNSQLIAAGASNSLSGVGGNVVESFLLSPFDLIAGGRINLTPGVNSLVLDSIGADTQINLRALPPAPSTSTVLPTSSLLVGSSTASSGTSNSTSNGTSSVNGSGSIIVFRQFATTTTSTNSGAGTTLEALQSTTVSNPYGVSSTFVSNGNGSQTLTSVSGGFTSAGNIVEPLPTGQPIQTVPPAPPGIILKVNRVHGDLKAPINLQTDPKIFGYDPTTGQVIRFDLNLNTNTGVVDSTFAPISVPGDPAVAGLDLAWNGIHRDILVSSGSNVFAYNASSGAFVGSFTDVGSFIGSVPINSIGATDTLTVLGSYQTNELYAINLPASLQTGVAQPAPGNPPPLMQPPQFTLLGGLTSSPGTNFVFATVAAHLDSTQPDQTQLAVEEVGTASVKTVKGQGSVFSNQLSVLGNTAIKEQGGFVNVPATQPTTSPPGPALGSIDQSLALVLSASGGTNKVDTQNGAFTFDYPDALAGLSESFRPDLVGAALIYIQGTVQSIRGNTATGMVLNDTGNLNLVKFASVTDSTIVGQPIGHIQFKKRMHVSIMTPSRTAAGRNGVSVNKSLHQIGPLTQPND